MRIWRRWRSNTASASVPLTPTSPASAVWSGSTRSLVADVASDPRPTYPRRRLTHRVDGRKQARLILFGGGAIVLASVEGGRMAKADVVLADLAAESAELDGLVADLDDAGWATPTPAAGWTIAHQIAHLAWTDRAAVLAVADPAGFADHLREAASDPDGFVDRGAQAGAQETPATILAGWRDARERLA